MSSAVRFTSDCGELPPIVVHASSAAVTPICAASSWAGLPYRHDSRLTTRNESTVDVLADADDDGIAGVPDLARAHVAHARKI